MERKASLRELYLGQEVSQRRNQGEHSWQKWEHLQRPGVRMCSMLDGHSQASVSANRWARGRTVEHKLGERQDAIFGFTRTAAGSASFVLVWVWQLWWELQNGLWIANIKPICICHCNLSIMDFPSCPCLLGAQVPKTSSIFLNARWTVNEVAPSSVTSWTKNLTGEKSPE